MRTLRLPPCGSSQLPVELRNQFVNSGTSEMADAKPRLTSSDSAPAFTPMSTALNNVRTTKDTTDTDNSATTTDGGVPATKTASYRKLRGNSSISMSKFNNNFSPARKTSATTTSSRKSSPRMQRANSMNFNFETVRAPRVRSPPSNNSRHRGSSSGARSSTPSNSLHPSLMALLTTTADAGPMRPVNALDTNHPSEYEIEQKPVVFRRQYERLDWKRLAAIDVEQMYRTKNYDALSDNLLQLTFCDVESEITNGDPRLLQLFKLAQLGLEFLLFNYDRTSKALERARKDRQNAEMKLLHAQTDAESRLSHASATITSLREELKRRKKTIAAQQEILNALSSSGNFALNNYHSCAYCSKSFIDGVFLEKHINARHPELVEHFYASIQTAGFGNSTIATAYQRSRNPTPADFNANDDNRVPIANSQNATSSSRLPVTNNHSIGAISDAELKAPTNKNDSLQVNATGIPVTKSASQMAMQEMLRELRELKTKIASAEKEHQQERNDYQTQLESLSQREANLREMVLNPADPNNLTSRELLTTPPSGAPLQTAKIHSTVSKNDTVPELNAPAREAELAQQIDQLKQLIDAQAQQQQTVATTQLQAVERAHQARYASLVDTCAKHASVEDLRRFLHTELQKMNEQFERRLERARTEYKHDNAEKTRDLLDELEHSKQRLFEATRAVAEAVVANEKSNVNVSQQQTADSSDKNKASNELARENDDLPSSVIAGDHSPKARRNSIAAQATPTDVSGSLAKTLSSDQTNVKNTRSAVDANQPQKSALARNDEVLREQQMVTSSTQQLATLINMLNSNAPGNSHPQISESTETDVAPTKRSRHKLTKSKTQLDESEITSSSDASRQQLNDRKAEHRSLPAEVNIPPHPSPSGRKMLRKARGEMLERMTSERGSSQRQSAGVDHNQYEAHAQPVYDIQRTSATLFKSKSSRVNPASNNLASSAIDVSQLKADEVQLLQQVLLTKDDDDEADDHSPAQAERILAEELRRANNGVTVSANNRSDENEAERDRKRLSKSPSSRVQVNSAAPASPVKRTSLIQAAEIIASSLVGNHQQQELLEPEEREFLAQLLQESNSRQKLNVANSGGRTAADGNRRLSQQSQRPTVEGALSPSSWRSRSPSVTTAAVTSLTRIADRVLNDANRRAVVNELLKSEIGSDEMWRDSVAGPPSATQLRRQSPAASASVDQREQNLQNRILQRQNQKSVYDVASATANPIIHTMTDSASDVRVTNRWSAHVSPRVSRALLQDANFLAQFRQQAEREVAKRLSEAAVDLIADDDDEDIGGSGLTDEQMQQVLLAADDQRQQIATNNQRFSNYRRLHEQSLTNLNAALEAAHSDGQTAVVEAAAAAEEVEYDEQEIQELSDDIENEPGGATVSADSLMVNNEQQLPSTSGNVENMGEMWQTNRELDAVRTSFELLNPQKRVSFSSRVSRFMPDADLSVADAAASASSYTTHVNLRQQQQQPSAAIASGGGGGGVEMSTSFDDALVAPDGDDDPDSFNGRRVITSSVSASDVDKLSADDSFISMLDPVVDKCIQVPSTRDFATSDSNIAVPIPAMSSFWMHSEPEIGRMVSADTIHSGGNLDEQSGYVEQFDDAEQVNSEFFHPQAPKNEKSARISMRSGGGGGLTLGNADATQFRSSTMLLQQLASKRDVSIKSRTHVAKKDTGTSGPSSSRFNSRAALADSVRQETGITSQRKQQSRKIVVEENDDDDDDEAVDVDEAARILLGQPLTTGPNGLSDNSSDDDVPDPDLQTLPVLDRNKKAGRNSNAANSLLPSTVSAAESIVYSLSERSSFRPPTGVASTATDVQLSSPSSIDLAALTSTLTAMPDIMSNEQRALNLKVQSIMMNTSSSHLVSAPQPHATGAVIAPSMQKRPAEVKLSNKDLQLIAALRSASPTPASDEERNAREQRHTSNKSQPSSSTANVGDLAAMTDKPFVQQGYVRAGDNGVLNATSSTNTGVPVQSGTKNVRQNNKIPEDNVSDDLPPTHEKVIIVGGNRNHDTDATQISSAHTRDRTEIAWSQSGALPFDVAKKSEARSRDAQTIEPAPVAPRRRSRPSIDLAPRLKSSLISLDDIEKEMNNLNVLPSSSAKTQQNEQAKRNAAKQNSLNTAARPRSAATTVDDSDND